MTVPNSTRPEGAEPSTTTPLTREGKANSAESAEVRVSDEFVAASEERNDTPQGGWTTTVLVAPGVRLFRVSDELASRTLFDWSEPVQLKLEKLTDGTYDLVARTFRPEPAPFGGHFGGLPYGDKA